LELLFLDGVLNYGQGFLVCMIFGFDDKLIVEPLMKKYSAILYMFFGVSVKPFLLF